MLWILRKLVLNMSEFSICILQLRKNDRVRMNVPVPIDRKLSETAGGNNYKITSKSHNIIQGDFVKPLISVIVPIYNVENYLIRCVDSILSQTYRNLEVILVDDGSPDNCGRICDELAKRDDRIKVIHKENGGLSSARNAGLDIATGELIAFIDSDDWLELDAYEYCVNLLKENQSEAVQYSYSMVSYPTNIKQPYEKIQTLKDGDILQNYMLTSTSSGSYSVCRCVFSKEMLKGLRFREGKINEDIDFKYKALSRCRKFTISNQCKYNYFQSGDSISTGGLKQRDFDLYEAADELYRLTRDEAYGDIAKLGAVKKARTAFSLLSRIAYYGVADQTLSKEQLVLRLTAEHRKNLVRLLDSPIPASRKILSVMFAINYHMTEKIIHLVRRFHG